MDLIAVLNRLCTPAFLYAVVHIFFLTLKFLTLLGRGTLFQSKMLTSLIINIIWIAVVAYLLNFLCKRGLGPLSWLLVLAPFIIMLGAARRTVDISDPNPLSGLMYK